MQVKNADSEGVSYRILGNSFYYNSMDLGMDLGHDDLVVVVIFSTRARLCTR